MYVFELCLDVTYAAIVPEYSVVLGPMGCA